MTRANFTKIGRKANVAYRARGRSYRHDDPQPGKWHALNLGTSRYGGVVYVALCGESVETTYEDDFGYQQTDHLREPGERPVTCKRCLALLNTKNKEK